MFLNVRYSSLRGHRVKGSLVDARMKQMEVFTQHLESVVEEKTKQYLEEKSKTEEMLYKVMPK